MREPWEYMPEPIELHIPDKLADRIAELYEQMHDEMMEEFFEKAMEFFDCVTDEFDTETIREAIVTDVLECI